MQKRILITGATGLLGTSLSRYLTQLSHEVITHGSGGKPASVTFDLSDGQSTARHLDTVAPEVIINLVALTNVDRCETERDQAYRLNVVTVENLTDWIETRANPVPLIHISTDQLYDGPGLKDESQLTLLNVYAWSKYCGELVAGRVEATCLRTNFFGRSELPGRQSFSDWLVDRLDRGEPLSLFSDIYFSPLGFPSLCRAIARVVEAPVPGAYNLGSRGGMSKADFCLSLAQQLGRDTRQAQITTCETGRLVAPRPRDMRMDCRLFEETFQLPLPELKNEIESMGEYYEISESILNQREADRPGAPNLLHR